MRSESKTRLVPFTAEHGRELLIGAPGWFAIHESQERYIEALQKGPGYSIITPEGLIGAGGIMLMWKGVGEAWALTSPLTVKYKMAFHRAVLRGMDKIIQAYDMHRVQATVHAKYLQGQKWCMALGMHVEGESRLMGPEGETMIRYVKFPKEKR